MKKTYFIITFIVMIVLLFVLTGCGNKENTNNANNQENTSKVSDNKEQDEEEIDYKAAAEEQMAMPKNNETIAIIKVKDFGDIKVKFFKNVAPKAVENFVNHSKEGYYDGLTFHRIIDEFMIQGGDPLGTGMGGESIWGEGFGPELDKKLVPYRGSLCMAMSSLPNSIGSQFFITQANYSSTIEKTLKKSGYPSELLEQYKKYGGYLSLYMNYTVFGQVFEGLDVVDKIAKVETYTTEDGQEDKPVKDVVIETIEITTYDEKSASTNKTSNTISNEVNTVTLNEKNTSVENKVNN